MAQDTKLVVKEAEIIPAREMGAVSIFIANETLHGMSRPLTELLFWGLKADSNNSPTICDPDDITELKNHLDWYRVLRDNAKNNINQPKPKLEVELAVIHPSSLEMRRYTNKCLEQVMLQVYRLLRILVDLPEAGLKVHISDASFATLLKAENAVAGAITTFLEGPKGPAPLSALGRLIPDPDFDYERLREPNADSPRLGHPDAPDVPDTQLRQT